MIMNKKHVCFRMNILWQACFLFRSAYYDTVVAADFADLECEASAKSVTGTRYE